jgi:hypothetical protein
MFPEFFYSNLAQSTKIANIFGFPLIFSRVTNTFTFSQVHYNRGVIGYFLLFPVLVYQITKIMSLKYSDKSWNSLVAYMFRTLTCCVTLEMVVFRPLEMLQVYNSYILSWETFYGKYPNIMETNILIYKL